MAYRGGGGRGGGRGGARRMATEKPGDPEAAVVAAEAEAGPSSGRHRLPLRAGDAGDAGAVPAPGADGLPRAHGDAARGRVRGADGRVPAVRASGRLQGARASGLPGLLLACASGSPGHYQGAATILDDDVAGCSVFHSGASTPAHAAERLHAGVRAGPAASSAPSPAALAKEAEKKLFVSETALAPPAAAAAAAAAAHGTAATGADDASDLATVGKKVMIRANHFLVNVADNDLFHYDVS
ncbi:unnamed protein product [Miscanthus lutarioriparius]|uniref:Uncharacterized protein n=1 Tax=Miscanthus lutarioriparius TaxID=422564 RepID=A0A811MMW3_9POAL|nr:unnamed protein product [Miscanthus lutarioriparius]